MGEILNYLLCGFVGGITMWVVLTISFMFRIKSGSEKQEPVKILGETYFFMTQDQIQKAAQSINRLEASYEKDIGRDWHKIPDSEMEVN